MRLPDADESYRWIWHVLFERDEVYRVSSEDTRDISYYVHLIDGLRSGQIVFYVPLSDDGKPMGLTWGNKLVEFENSWAFHIAFLKEFWGRGTVAAAAKMVQFAEEDIGVKRLVALIPRFNDRCRSFISRLGYAATGRTQNNLFIRNGHSEPCDEYVLEV